MAYVWMYLVFTSTSVSQTHARDFTLKLTFAIWQLINKHTGIRHITRTLRTHLRYISFEYRILIVFSQLLVLFSVCFNSQPNLNQSNDEPNETWRQILTTHVFYCVHVFVNGRERVYACVPARICVFVCVSDPFTTHTERRDFNACVNLSYGNVTEESKCDSTSNPVSIHKHQFTWHNQRCIHILLAAAATTTTHTLE